MVALLLLGLVPADSPSETSLEAEVVIAGKLESGDLTQRRLVVSCAGAIRVKVDVPEGSRINVNGVGYNTMTVISRTLARPGELDVTIRRLPGGGGKLDIIIHNKLNLMSEAEYLRLTGTPP
jgi:hypothetical protein